VFLRKTSRFVGAIILFSAFSLAIPAADALAGQGRGGGQAKKADKADKADKDKADKDKADKDKADKDKADKKDGRPEAIAVDRDGHIRVIREYARGGSLPPGLAKRESLPPGLRKQLRERGELPPGLQRRLVPVPAYLVTRLPPVPPYYRRYFAGDDLIVIDTRTHRIAVIILDVWR
jgi:hypothetical protein